MLINNKKEKSNICREYYRLRLTWDGKTELIKIYPCCFAAVHSPTKPVGILSFDQILMSDNVFELLENCYKSIPIYPINCKCNEMNPGSCIHVCKFNQEPIHTIDLSILHNCNINCSMCGIPNDDNKKLIDVYFKLLESLKQHNLEILFTQQGEPFYYKDKVFNFLKTLKSNDYSKITFISNLTMLNENDIETLYNISLNTNIPINGVASIDGITEETYKKIRRNNLFGKVINNAKLLIKYNILHKINFVVQDKNLNELFDAYHYWHDGYNIYFDAIVVDDFSGDQHNRIKNSEIYKNYINLISH